MSKLINLIYDKASIEAIKADLYDNRDNKDYVNIVDEYGNTALTAACILGNIEVVKLFLDPFQNLELAKMIAIRDKHLELFTLLEKFDYPVILNNKKYKLVELVEEK